jgi:DNA end-binding protein Ku
MPRSLWTGSLGFGLVNVPVALFSGVRDTDLHFRQLHAKDHTPVEIHRFCAEEDVEVPYEEIASGYETDDDLVILTDAELATAAPRKTRTIDIEAFVDLADVDPIYFDHPYVLMPSGDSEGTQRAYRLLVEVMERTERAALGRFVLRTKEYLVLIRAAGGRMKLTTLRFHDEVRPAKDVPKPTKRDKPAKKEVDQAVALIEALACPWDPAATRTASRSG